MNKTYLVLTLIAALAITGLAYATHGTQPLDGDAGQQGYHTNLYADHLLGATSTLIKVKERMHINDDTATSSQFSVNAPAGNDPLRARVGGSTKLLVGSNGGVTIGTFANAPADGLHVQGRLDANDDVQVQGVLTANNDVNVQGRLQATGGIQGADTGGRRAVVTPYVNQDSVRCAWDGIKNQCRPDNSPSASCNSGDFSGPAETVQRGTCLDKRSQGACEGTTFQTEYVSCLSLDIN